MRPEAASAGTLKDSVPGETMPKVTTAAPPTVTSGCGDFSFNPEPSTVTSVFVGPLPGEKLEMLGRILKPVAEETEPSKVPLGGKRVILPVEALAGTLTRMVVLLEIVKSL